MSLLRFLLLCFAGALQAQVGIGTMRPDASAILDLTANDKGLLLPRVTLADRSAAGLSPLIHAVSGLLVYNSNQLLDHGTGLYYYQEQQWQRLQAFDPDLSWQWLGQGMGYDQGHLYVGTSAASNKDLWLSRRIIDWDNNNYFMDLGAISRLNELVLDPGSISDLSLYFGQEESGFYSPEPHVLSYVSEGTEALRINQEGLVGLHTDDPLADLDVNGQVKLGVHGSVISGVHLWDWPFEVLPGASGSVQFNTIETSFINEQGVSLEAYIQGHLYGESAGAVRLNRQWVDQNGYHFELYCLQNIESTIMLHLKILVLY